MISTLEAAKSVAIDDTYILGPLLILQHMFARFGIATLLDNIVRKHPQLEFNFPRIMHFFSVKLGNDFQAHFFHFQFCIALENLYFFSHQKIFLNHFLLENFRV